MSDAPKSPRDDAFLPRSPLGQRKQPQSTIRPERPRIGEPDPAPTILPSEPPRELKWGVVGIAHELKLNDAASQEYIIYRRVDRSVGYDPPLAEPPWSPSQSRPNTYEMVFVGNVQQVRTLGELGEGLRTIPPATENDQRLSKLNAAALALVREASRLQGPPGLGVGLLSPQNVLVAEDGQVILPDVGYFWKGGIIPPRWLVPEQEFRPLWDDVLFEAYSQRQERCPVVAEILNVQTVARVIAAAITGTAARLVEAPIGNTALFWQALVDAATGKVRTLRDFSQRLENTPPSQHYFYVPPDDSELSEQKPDGNQRKGGVVLLVVGGILGAVAVGAGVYTYLNNAAFRSDKTGDGQVQVRPDESTDQPGLGKLLDLDKGISQLDQAKDADQGNLLANLLEAAKAASPDQQKRLEPELAVRRERFFNDNWLKRFTKIQEEILNDQTRRFSAGAEFRKLANELEQVRRFPCPNPTLNAQEKQWLEYAQELARQLNLE